MWQGLQGLMAGASGAGATSGAMGAAGGSMGGSNYLQMALRGMQGQGGSNTWMDSFNKAGNNINKDYTRG